MLTILLAIAPIFAVMLLGHALRRGGIPSLEFWNLNDRLVYWVLIPSLLFYKMSKMTVSADLIGNYAIVVLGGYAAAFGFGLVASRFCDGAAAGSSVLQGAARHNTFIALAVAERLYGSEGLALAALGSALLIPVTNLSVVPTLAIMLRKDDGQNMLLAISRELVRNPLLLAVGLGLLVNQWGVSEIPVVHDVTRILGSAALPIVLLCVGANIRVRKMVASAKPVIISLLGKMLIFPLVIFALSRSLGLSETQTLVAMLFGAAPTAASGFTLAREMGGDAPLMAAIITVQTLVSLLVLPLTIVWASTFF
jgi:malonate transporter